MEPIYQVNTENMTPVCREVDGVLKFFLGLYEPRGHVRARSRVIPKHPWHVSGSVGLSDISVFTEAPKTSFVPQHHFEDT